MSNMTHFYYCHSIKDFKKNNKDPMFGILVLSLLTLPVVSENCSAWGVRISFG